MNEALVKTSIINMKDAYYLKQYVDTLQKQNKKVRCSVLVHDHHVEIKWNVEFMVGMLVDYVLRKEVVFND